MKMGKSNSTLSMGQKSKFPAIALGLSLAMAAPAMAVDWNGSFTIEAGYTGPGSFDVGTKTVTDTASRFGPDGGSSGTMVITDGYTFATSGRDGDAMRFAENGSAATLTVEVGGHFQGDTEMQWNEGEVGTQQNRLNVFGTAYVEQLKMGGFAGDDKTVVGNGTDAATLTIKEGNLGKEGNATLTINDLSTMIVTKTWGYKIDSGLGTNTGAYINLVGSGTLKVNAGVTASNYNLSIQGDGVLGDWTLSSEVIDTVTYNVYTAGTAAPSTLAITSFTSLGSGNWELTLKGANRTAYEFYSSTTLDFTSGTLVENLVQIEGEGLVDGTNNSVLTTTATGNATVQMALTGDPADFVRAEEKAP